MTPDWQYENSSQGISLLGEQGQPGFDISYYCNDNLIPTRLVDGQSGTSITLVTAAFSSVHIVAGVALGQPQTVNVAVFPNNVTTPVADGPATSSQPFQYTTTQPYAQITIAFHLPPTPGGYYKLPLQVYAEGS